MSKISKKVKNLFFVFLIIFSLSICAGAVCEEPAKNIIIFIGDGMGYEHVKATSMYLTGSTGALSFESFDSKSEVTTYSADNDDNQITDSAAAATAIATGIKVKKKIISMRNGAELETMLEYFKTEGKATGLVTTAYMTDATPAAFGAHEPSRYNYPEIAKDYFTQTQPNVLFGGGGNGVTVSIAEEHGYTVVQNKTDLMSPDTESKTMVSGQFGDTDLPYEYDGNYDNIPHLSDLTQVAIDILDNDPDGFFLMVEGGRIDHASHENNLYRMIYETKEFNNAVQKALDWAKNRTDALIIVTADHETGGLIVLENKGQEKLPSVSWTEENKGHTDVKVPVYAWGKGEAQIASVKDNADFFNILVGKPESVVLDEK